MKVSSFPQLDFSVIIPAYNAEKTIRRCLNSLKNQDYADSRFEVIVVNDNSTDATVSIITEFNYHCIHGDFDSISAVRNRAVKEAKGEILLFLDSDMIVDKHLLSTAKKIFDKGFNGGLSFSDHAPSCGSWIGKIWNNPLRISTNKTHKANILFSRILFINKDLHIKIGMFDEDLFKGGKAGEDKEYSFRLKYFDYPLLIDASLDNIHLGYEKNIWEFIRKEFWRQGNMLPVALKYGFKLRMILHPMFCGYHLFSLVILIISLLFQRYTMSGLFFLSWILPSFLFSLRRMDIKLFWHHIPVLWFLQLLRWSIAGFALIPQIASFTQPIKKIKPLKI